MIRITVEVTDDANPEAPPVVMRVIEEGYGVAVSLANPYGTEIGRVALDYHDNVLKALIYKDDEDDPMIVALCGDVTSAMKGPP